MKDIFHERAWIKSNIFNVQVKNRMTLLSDFARIILRAMSEARFNKLVNSSVHEKHTERSSAVWFQSVAGKKFQAERT